MAHSAEESGPQITCRCGQVLNLAGAVPGRKGRCPSCGRRFEVGEMPAAPPGRTDEPEPFGPGVREEAGYDLGPAHETRAPVPLPEYGAEAVRDLVPGDSGPARRTGKDRDAWRADAPRRKKVEAVGPDGLRTSQDQAIGRSGLLPMPPKPDPSFQSSLAYPFWDTTGLGVLLLLAPVMAVVSLIVFSVLPMLNQGGEKLLLGPLMCGFTIVLALALGYLFLLLEGMLGNSAHGENRHPRWPDIEMFGMMLALLRWAAIWGIPVGLIWLLTRGVTTGWSEHVWSQALGAGLYALSAFVSLVTLLALVLHEDVGAASPLVVLPAVFRLGTALLAPVLVAVAMAVATVLGYHVLVKIGTNLSIPILMSSTWIAWVLLLYAAIVLVRVTGMAYYGRSKEVGWFHREPRRVEVVAEAPPVPDDESGPPAGVSEPADYGRADPIPVEDDGMGDW